MTADKLVRELIQGAVKRSSTLNQSGDFYAGVLAAADAIYSIFDAEESK